MDRHRRAAQDEAQAMKAGIQKPGREFFTPEQCYINEAYEDLQ